MNDPTVLFSMEKVKPERDDTVAVLTLNRPVASNAFDPPMLRAIGAHCRTIRESKTLRALILRAAGDYFCAGADIGWMRDSSKQTPEENQRESAELGDLFYQLYSLPVPTIALVEGPAFGGGVGLIACCDWAIATQDAKFCLSEVKLGVVAAVILPHVMKRISQGSLRRYALSARMFGPEEAFQIGLVQRVIRRNEIDEVLQEELGHILKGSPLAQAKFKSLHGQLVDGDAAFFLKTREAMVETIASLRAGPSGQEGLSAFLEKRPPEWAITLSDKWKLPEVPRS